jgi:hypothetical protein
LVKYTVSVFWRERDVGNSEPSRHQLPEELPLDVQPVETNETLNANTANKIIFFIGSLLVWKTRGDDFLPVLYNILK